MPAARRARSVDAILRDARALAVEYYALTGRPLGVTAEVAEYEAVERLGLTLADARTAGYDALRVAPDGSVQRVQIKGRRLITEKSGGRMPAINLKHDFDSVVLVELDEWYEPVVIWEADRADVERRLTAPAPDGGISKSRNLRGQMAVSQFRTVARRVWSAPAGERIT